MNTRVLITGGAGFIGSSLAQRLVKKGASVTILDAMIPPYGGNLFNITDIRKKIIFLKGDVREKTLMKKLVRDKDIVFHLAGQTGRLISMQNPALDVDINCNGTLAILTAIKETKKKIKFIYAGSRGVIGKPVYFPVDENHPTNPRDVYGANKLLAENYAFLYGREYNFPVTVLRLNNIYGPRCQIKSNHYGTINLFIAYALQGRPIPIYGNGRQTRDYVYIDDATDAFVKAIDAKADSEIFMVSSGKEHSLLEIARLIAGELEGTTYTLVPYPPQLGKLDFPRFLASYKKIYQVLKWKPKVTLKQGIKETIAFYRKYLQHYL